MKKLTLLFLLGFAFTAQAQWGSGVFRLIAGSGVTLSYSNGAYTISSSVAAGTVDSSSIVNVSVAATDLVNSSILNAKIANGAVTVNKFASSVYPAIRQNIGWTSNGTITADTVTTRIEWGGTPNTTIKIFDADGDTVIINPQNLNMITLKDGSTVLAVLDSVGNIVSGGIAGGNTTVAMQPAGSQPLVRLKATDGDEVDLTITTSDQMKFDEATGGYYFEDSGIIIGSPTGGHIGAGTSNATGYYTNGFPVGGMLEFLGGALKETPTTGASDTTANYMPMKAFSVGDTATFDIFLSKRFASLDSIVVYAYANTATSAVVFNCGVRQTAVGGAIAGAFNTAATKTISTGTAGTLRQWSLTSFGSLTASTPSMLRGKIYRTAGGTGGDVFVNRVLIYGVGLR